MPLEWTTSKHVVVLMLENRSFDNLLGWLYADQSNQPRAIFRADSALLHSCPPQLQRSGVCGGRLRGG